MTIEPGLERNARPVRVIGVEQPGGDTEYGVKVNLDKQAWKDDQAELSLSYIASAHLGDAYEYGFTFGPLLTVTLAAPTPLLDAVHTWVTPVQRLMELASGKGESITYLQALGKNAAGEATPVVEVIEVDTTTVEPAAETEPQA